MLHLQPSRSATKAQLIRLGNWVTICACLKAVYEQGLHGKSAALRPSNLTPLQTSRHCPYIGPPGNSLSDLTLCLTCSRTGGLSLNSTEPGSRAPRRANIAEPGNLFRSRSSLRLAKGGAAASSACRAACCSRSDTSMASFSLAASSCTSPWTASHTRASFTQLQVQHSTAAVLSLELLLPHAGRGMLLSCNM